MSRAAGHQDSGEGERGDAFDWFRVLDIAVWVAVTVVVVIGLEMLVGRFVRERIARDATRYIERVRAGKGEADPA